MKYIWTSLRINQKAGEWKFFLTIIRPPLNHFISVHDNNFSFLLSLKISSIKIDLIILKVLNIDSFETPRKLLFLTNFCNFSILLIYEMIFLFFLFKQLHFAGIVANLNFRESQKLKRKSISFIQKVLYLIFLHVTANVSSKQSIFNQKSFFWVDMSFLLFKCWWMLG